MTDLFRKGLDRLVSLLPRVCEGHVLRPWWGCRTAPNWETQRQMNIKWRLLIRSAAFGVNGVLIQKKKGGRGSSQKKTKTLFPVTFLLILSIASTSNRRRSPSRSALVSSQTALSKLARWDAEENLERVLDGGGGVVGPVHVFIVSARPCDAVQSGHGAKVSCCFQRSCLQVRRRRRRRR